MRRLTTGNRELDHVLGGGLPTGSLITIAGAPGTGKTILAQQVCFAVAAAGGSAVYYTTWSEPHDKLVRHLQPFSFFDETMLGQRLTFVHLTDLIDGRDGIGAVAEEILRTSFSRRPDVIVLDSSKALQDVAPPEQLRRAIYDLASKVAQSDAVLIFVGEYGLEETRTEPEFAVADGILLLENEAHGPVDRRGLRVLKMRGGEIVPGRHSFRIAVDGFQVFPRLETTLPEQVPMLEGRAALGIAGLDEELCGGVPRGDSCLVLGPSGVGKTMLALRFTQTGLERGERCLHLSFQESADQLLERAAGAGWDLRSAIGDRLVIRHLAPVELDLDQVGTLLRAEIADGVGRVVIDSLAELAFAAHETDRLPAYIWALTGFVRAKGGTTLITNEIEALGGGDVGRLSFLFDDVVFLRYVEIASELRRGANVLKMRRSHHGRGLLEFTVDENGITTQGELTGLTGLLGWSALRSDLE